MPAGRCAVIGSGMSGLCSAVLLAEAGWKVTVFEQHAVPGGLLQRFKRGRRWFDTGMHFITGSQPGGIFRRILARLQVLDQVEFLPLDTRRQFTVRVPEVGELDVPTGIAAGLGALRSRWPEQAAGLDRFTERLFATLVAYGWLDSLAPPGTPPAPELDHQRTVAEVLAECGITGPCARLVGSLSSILAQRAEHCPFPLFCTFAGSGLAGAWRVRHGGTGLVDPLIARLRSLGGELHLRNGVAAIRHADRVASAVVDERGVEHPVDAVVGSCHPAEVIRLAGSGGFRPSFISKVAETPDSASALIVFIELSAHAGIGPSHQFSRLPTGEDLYYVAPADFDPGELPSLEAMVWIPAGDAAPWRDSRLGQRPEAYLEWKRDWEHRLVEQVCFHHPHLRPLIGRVWSSSPLTIRDYIRSRGGGAMGLSHDVGWLGSAPLSMRNHLRNVFLVGQSVGHPGVLGTSIAAFALVGSLTGRDLRADLV